VESLICIVSKGNKAYCW